MKTLSGFVIGKRSELGMSQAELSRRSGVPVTTLNRIETGVTKLPGADVRRQLAKALHVDHVEILIAAGEITEDELIYSAPAAPIDATRASLIRRVEAIRLTPERVGSLERILDLYLSIDAGDVANESADTRNGFRVTG